MLRWNKDIAKQRRFAVLAFAASVALSACGSTVQWSSTVADGSLDDSLGAPNGDAGMNDPSSRTPGTTSSGHNSRMPGAPGEQPNGSETQSGTRGQGDATSPAPGTSGRGFTTKEIYIGYGTLKAAEKVFAAAGVAADFGDQEAQARTAIKKINDSGGIQGRRVVPVFYDFDYANASANQDAEGQVACSRWTEDRPVFAVVNLIAISDNALSACLAQRQTPLITGIQLRPRSTYLRLSPYLYTPSAPTYERLLPIWLKRLSDLGYFGKWDHRLGQSGSDPVKVGILSTKYLNGKVFTDVARNELRRRSVQVAATFEWSGDVARVSDEMNLAVLRFRDKGVTHVVSSAVELRYFTTSASQQQYRPRYAVQTRHGLTVLTELSPQGQLHGAVGVGWSPTDDVNSAHDPGPVSAAQSQCTTIMKKAGQNTAKPTHSA